MPAQGVPNSYVTIDMGRLELPLTPHPNYDSHPTPQMTTEIHMYIVSMYIWRYVYLWKCKYVDMYICIAVCRYFGMPGSNDYSRNSDCYGERRECGFPKIMGTSGSAVGCI